MTEIEAHQFIARWSRRMITWRARNEAEQVRDLSQSCMGALGGAVLMAISALYWSQGALARSVAESFAVVVGGFSLWMLLQLRQVKQTLYQLPESNRK